MPLSVGECWCKRQHNNNNTAAKTDITHFNLLPLLPISTFFFSKASLWLVIIFHRKFVVVVVSEKTFTTFKDSYFSVILEFRNVNDAIFQKTIINYWLLHYFLFHALSISYESQFFICYFSKPLIGSSCSSTKMCTIRVKRHPSILGIAKE